MHARLPARDVVLLGAGHTNAHVLRMWRMSPLRDVRLTCVSNLTVATYSGMLPGTLAGLYEPARMQIDLVRLCASVGARFVQGTVTGLDRVNRRLLLAVRPALPYDVLSIGIGSLPRGPEADAAGTVPAASHVVAIKPMQTFLARMSEAVQPLREARTGRLRIAVVGAGAGGVEIALCLPRWLAAQGVVDYELHLVDRGAAILPGQPKGAVQRARTELARRGVQMQLGSAVREVSDGGLILADGRRLEFQLVLWATGAQAPPILRHLGLPTDEAGFLRTRPTLQSTADPAVFVVGDAGTIDGAATPKAGVYAVRQGPILWENVQKFLDGRPLVEYRPQRGFLSLLATGDGRAIANYKGFSAVGRWCWRLKDSIDSRFMAKYQEYRLMTPRAAALPLDEPEQMQCAGCGCKLGGSVLSRVLARLEIPRSEHVLLGLDAPDDAAVVALPEGRPVVATTDFFTAFLDDPYLVGRIAALHAASDVIAMSARPIAALALATVPHGPAEQQEQLLYELLAGGLEEFKQMGATLVGGHTTEAEQLMIGYTILAAGGAGPPRTKSGLREGDCLVLTKPLGTGVLLAAHMQARCRAVWMERLLAAMLASHQPAGDAADAFDLPARTDVTGFGLAGHLFEMLRASRLSAELQLHQVPLLPGTAELLAEGLESTLAPDNRRAAREIAVSEEIQCRPEFGALFDPQTSGGLLLGVSERVVETLLKRIADTSSQPAYVIGRVVAATKVLQLVVRD